MHVRVHEVEAVGGRGCDSAGFDGGAGLVLVGAHADTAVGSEAGSAEVQGSDVAAAAEAEESHVRYRYQCQWPRRGGESGGTEKPYQTRNESPKGGASSAGSNIGQDMGRMRKGRGEMKGVVRERECYQGRHGGLCGHHGETHALRKTDEWSRKGGSTVGRTGGVG
jgi:hypothetical protein